MKLDGSVLNLKIKQHMGTRTVIMEFIGQISEDQERIMLDAFMKSQVNGALSIEEKTFGKEISFAFGETVEKNK